MSDFSRDEIIVTQPGDPRLGIDWRPDGIGWEQCAAGPLCLVIGPEADRSKIPNLLGSLNLDESVLVEGSPA